MHVICKEILNIEREIFFSFWKKKLSFDCQTDLSIRLVNRLFTKVINGVKGGKKGLFCSVESRIVYNHEDSYSYKVLIAVLSDSSWIMVFKLSQISMW